MDCFSTRITVLHFLHVLFHKVVKCRIVFLSVLLFSVGLNPMYISYMMYLSTYLMLNRCFIMPFVWFSFNSLDQYVCYCHPALWYIFFRDNRIALLTSIFNTMPFQLGITWYTSHFFCSGFWIIWLCRAGAVASWPGDWEWKRLWFCSGAYCGGFA